MNNRVLLGYQRMTSLEEERQLFEGHVRIEYEYKYEVTEFRGVDFRDLLELCSRMLKKEPDFPFYFFRLESGRDPMRLDDTTTRTLREDPQSAYQVLYHPVQHVDASPKALHTVVRAGYETLSAAFGEVVYCRRRAERIESPLDGRWVYAHTNQLPKEIDGGSDWMGFRVEDLLTRFHTQERFYFPREWNQGRPWISYADLADKYAHYLKEKAECSRAATPEV